MNSDLIKTKYKRILTPIICFIGMASGLMMSCVDKELIPEEPEQNNGIVFDCDGYSLSFIVNLDGAAETRGEDDIDNYIDTKNKFRVLFFDKNFNFIFEAVDRSINPVTDETSGKGDRYYVHIPMNLIVDRDGNIYDAEKIREELRNESFTVAVLANWPNDGKLEPGDEEIDENGTVIRPEPYYQKGEPKWGYFNSIMASVEDQTKSNYSLKNINDLHHLEDNSKYLEKSSSDSRPHPYQVYSFIMEDGKMGVRSNWIENQFSGKSDAESWIRANWDPSQAGKATYLNSYDYLWYLWNFTAANRASSTRFDNNVGSWGQAWVDKNHYKKNDTHPEKPGPHTEDSPLYKFITSSNLSVVLDDTTDDANLYFDPADFTSKTQKTATKVFYDSKEEKVAVRIPNKDDEGNTSSQRDKNNPYGIRFTANSTGTLTIKCATEDNSTVSNGDPKARIAIFNSHSGESSSVGTIPGGGTITPITKSISVTEDPVDYYIYCDRGTSADIFEIEYINDQYLYETTRQAIEPTKENPIPMYGVENFNAIGQNWKEGSTYDISQSFTDNPIIIGLVRSLAKVEVYLPVKYGKPQHVFMRSVNRYSFAETMDVQSPRNWNLDQNDPHDAFYGEPNKRCEWHNIRDYGRGYNYNNNPTATNMANYQEWYSWFYRSWGETDIKWKNNGTTPWPFDGIGEPSTQLPYPHIFNCCIDRSDYARMIDKGQEEGFYKYIMYMPDKTVDDPNYPGMPESVPKVAHVEYRYNSNANLNDNECYRIYFMDYQDYLRNDINEFIKTIDKKDFEKKIEQGTYGDEEGEEKVENMGTLLWPIMRNHIFTFKVRDNGNPQTDGMPVIISSVKEWGYEKINVEW